MRCLLACALLAALPAQAQRRVALVVGNAAYGDAPLQNPVNDAEDVAAKLRELGFDVTLLTNRNRSQMTTAIREFGRSSSGADAALFYFAGHGVQVRGKNYLLPVGQRFADEAEVETDAVDTGAVLARLEEAGAKVSLLILDACRNNPLQRSSRSAGRGLARMEAPSGALIAFAAQPGAEAKDGTGRNGTFTKHLLKHIDTPGLPVEQVFKRVRSDVERETNRAQSPREESSLTADFTFANSPFAPVTPANRDRIEDEAWALCRSASTGVPCDDYMSGWPQGRYAALARTRLRELQAMARPPAPRPDPQPQPQPQPVQPPAPVAGRVVKDCDVCPELMPIPGGTFTMGSLVSETGSTYDERPQRRVTIQPFLLGRTEVTQGQWKAVMGSNPSAFSACGDECPVEQVSWNDAQLYVQKLNQRTGKQYRLPSEAEWEYSARAGSGARWSFGDDEGQLGAYAWYSTNSGRRYYPVAGKLPNAWGLHDMHGNLWEWVQDVWHDDYKGAPMDGSAWTSGGDQARRVRRGGSGANEPRGLRSASRSGNSQPDDRISNTGFRIARTL